MGGIVIENIGPIEHLELDAKPGTITVLVAPNGAGKSTALDAIGAITRGDGKLESRDGTTGGSATGFGVTIKVGRGGANRRTGDLEVVAVEDKLSIADFVDPPVKDPVAADARRLKALVSLVGLVADPEQFHALTGGRTTFDLIVKPESLKTSDPIELAERIKRDFESASRAATTQAERLYGEIKARHKANEGLDLTAESDGDTLQAGLESALNAMSRIEQRLTDAESEQTRREAAQKSLDESATSYRGPTIAEARRAVDEAVAAADEQRKAVDAARVVVDGIREKLLAAQTALTAQQATQTQRDGDVTIAKGVLASAERHNVTLATWQQTLADHAVSTAPTSEEVQHARGVVKVARIANETGVLIRAALQRKREAESLDAERIIAAKRADALRDAAKSVLDVLAEGVKTLVPGLTIDNEFRIVAPHPIRTTCYYADLSHGERWRLALDIAVAAFRRKGAKGVLAIPQEAWESLDGPNRRIVAEHVATTDLIVFTAESDKALNGEANGLRTEVVTP